MSKVVSSEDVARMSESIKQGRSAVVRGSSPVFAFTLVVFCEEFAFFSLMTCTQGIFKKVGKYRKSM